jgi:hypothetical protein
MKKTLLLSLFLSLFWACGKDTEPEPQEIEEITEQNQMYARFDELGIKPSDRESIDYFDGVVDSTSYKLAFGRKNGHAWISKFNSSGDEIFSFEVKETHQGMKYSHFNQKSIIYINADVLFLRGWHSNMETVNNIDNIFSFSALAFLSVVDMKNGKGLRNFDAVSGTGLYHVEKVFDAYLVSEGDGTWNDAAANPNQVGYGYDNLYMTKNGNILWKRKCTGYENSDGIDYYYNHKFMDYEKIIYLDDRLRNYPYLTIDNFGKIINFAKIINLRASELLYEFDTEKSPFHKSNGNLFPEYMIKDLLLSSDGDIQLLYTEYSMEITVDPISGQTNTKRNEIENYRYDMKADDYSILRHIRLSDMSEIKEDTPDIPDIPFEFMYNLTITTQIVFDASGMHLYLSLTFSTNVDSGVTVNEVRIYDATGYEPFDFVDLPVEKSFWHFELPVEAISLLGWRAEIVFTWNGEIYRVQSNRL